MCYRSRVVRGVKSRNGPLGIPTVADRLVQQAILQVLDPLLDPTFSESSYGFRPGRSAHQALRKASEYVAEGYPLEKFLVNHDVLIWPDALPTNVCCDHPPVEAGIHEAGRGDEAIRGDSTDPPCLRTSCWMR